VGWRIPWKWPRDLADITAAGLAAVGVGAFTLSNDAYSKWQHADESDKPRWQKRTEAWDWTTTLA
jgi:hypothetical protein